MSLANLYGQSLLERSTVWCPYQVARLLALRAIVRYDDSRIFNHTIGKEGITVKPLTPMACIINI